MAFPYDDEDVGLADLSPRPYTADQQRAFLASIAPPPPRPPSEPGILSDIGHLLQSGYASMARGVHWLAGQTQGLRDVLDTQSGQAYWAEGGEAAHDALSSAQKSAAQKKFFNNDYSLGDAWSDSRSYLGAVAEAVPGTVIGMGLGGPVTMGLRGAAMATLPKLGAIGANRVAMGAGAVGYGAGEGLVAAGADAVQAQDRTRQMPHEYLQRVSPHYRELLATQTPDAARETLAQRVAQQTALQSGLTVGALGAPMGIAFGQLFHGAGRLATTRARTAGLAALGELGQETAQSGAEQHIQNRAIRDHADPTRPLWQDVLNQAVTGMLTGGIMGGAMGAAGHGGQTAGTRYDDVLTGQRADAAIQQADGALNRLLSAPDDVLSESLATLGALPPKRLADTQRARVAAVIAQLQSEVARRAARRASTPTGEPGLASAFDPSLDTAPRPGDALADALRQQDERLTALSQWQREGVQRTLRNLQEAAVRREETLRLERAAQQAQQQPSPTGAQSPQSLAELTQRQRLLDSPVLEGELLPREPSGGLASLLALPSATAPIEQSRAELLALPGLQSRLALPRPAETTAPQPQPQPPTQPQPQPVQAGSQLALPSPPSLAAQPPLPNSAESQPDAQQNPLASTPITDTGRAESAILPQIGSRATGAATSVPAPRIEADPTTTATATDLKAQPIAAETFWPAPSKETARLLRQSIGRPEGEAVAQQETPGALNASSASIAPPSKPSDLPSDNPLLALARKIEAHFDEQSTAAKPLAVGLKSSRLLQMAQEALGGTQAQGTFSTKDAYDAMETGFNLAVLREAQRQPLNSGSAEQAQASLSRIEKMQSLLPTQTKRDGEQQAMQQFSTPHSHAHIAAWAANISTSDRVLEPTAGTGNLVAHAKLFNPAEIVANELSERRSGLLHAIPGIRVFRENANHLDAVLPKDVKPSVILMNPPFSADVNVPGKRKTEIGARHIEQALARLQPNGRLVAIVGRGMEMQSPRFRAWWREIAKNNTVQANIGISGKAYRKFGTTFDHRLLVIDKIGAAPDLSKIVTGQVENVADLIPLLERVRNARTNPSERDVAISSGEASAPRVESVPGTGGTVLPTARPDGDRVSPAHGGERYDGGAGLAGQPTPSAGMGAIDSASRDGGAVSQPRRKRGADAVSQQPPNASAGKPESIRDNAEPTARPDGLEIATTETVGLLDSQGFGASRFDQYRPAVHFKGAQPHPTPLAESAAMASVQPPPLTVIPKIPPAVVASGHLSSAQMEALAYAGQAHQRLLPDGSRQGYYIGDGTGVGKGAEIAGIILDNWNQGRKKAVWVSENASLLSAAQRDADWVSLGADKVFSQGKIKGAITIGEGVAFTTYATLTSAEQSTAEKKGLTRLDQLADWLGADFDGVIAFDESHNMMNAIALKGKRGTKEPSQAALSGIKLQQRFPKARVVYVSATGATEVSNLAYAERLGLWGEGTAFASKHDFIDNIDAGGLAAMEVVAKDLKAMGLYSARTLSYDGVEVEQLVHTLSATQRTLYDALARSWQIVLKNVDAAMGAAGAAKNAKARSAALSAFWGAHQRFFKGMMTALSVPSVIQDMQAELSKGHSAVLQLVDTNEAIQRRKLAAIAESGQTLEEIDMSPRDVLMQYLNNAFPVTRYEDYKDEDGTILTRPVLDSAGNIIKDPKSEALRDEMLMSLATMETPEGALEQIINHFGSDAVTEVTGRSQRVVRGADGKMYVERLGAARQAKEIREFEEGKRRILIFSDAGGTGRSYHADTRIANQQRRVHYLLQPGWRADKAIQGLGRTHRTNQASAPLVKVISTDLKAQRRFISSISRRMDQMGALTKGQRDANANGVFDEDSNLENRYSRLAIEALFSDIARGLETMTPAEIATQMGIHLVDEKTGQQLVTKLPSVQQFLNRLMSLDIEMMDRVFAEFDRRRRANIEFAKIAGVYDAGMETLVAESLQKTDEKVVATHPTGGETRYTQLEAEQKVFPITFEMLDLDNVLFARGLKTGNLFAFEKAHSVTDPETGNTMRRRRKVSQTDYSYVSETIATDKKRYEPLTFESEQAMRAAWDAAIKEAPKTRKSTIHMISGALLPVWNRLPSEAGRIIRGKTDSGERLIGRVIKPGSLNETLKRFGVGVDAVKMTGQAAIKAVLEDNATLSLSTGGHLVRRLVNGEHRIEWVSGQVTQGERDLRHRMGAFSEIVNWQARTFIPTNQPEVMARIVESNPIAEVVSADKTRYSRSQSPAAPLTASQARAQLVDALGEQAIASLEATGRLKIHATDPTKTGAAGFVDAQGVIHLVAPHLEGDALSVALHEAAHVAKDTRFTEGDQTRIRLAHAALRLMGLKNFIGSPSFTTLAQEAYRMAAEGDETAQKALAKAQTEGEADAGVDVTEEFVAYLAQYADETLPFVRRMISALRAALFRMGVKVRLTPADVRALAMSALKTQAKAAGKAGKARPATAFSQSVPGALVQLGTPSEVLDPSLKRIFYSQPASTEDAAHQEQLWQAFQAVRAQFQARHASTTAFERWFGQGVEGITAKKGQPLTLYHGSPSTFTRFDSARAGQNSQHPTAGLGFFMTADRAAAQRYGEHVLELHAKLANPYFLTDADLMGVDSVAKAAKLRQSLQAKGFDGAVVTGPGMAPYVIAFESKQVKLTSNQAPTESADFRFARPGQPSSPHAAPPAETKGQAFQRRIQDKFNRFEVVQNWLKAKGVNLTPDANVHGAEALLPKKTAAAIQSARETLLKPLVQQAAQNQWAIGGGELTDAIANNQPLPARFKPSITEFLHAQHAGERNAAIAKINPAFKDGGSGLTTQQATDLLARYRAMPNFAAFQKLANAFQAITQQTQALRLAAGIATPESIKAQNAAYQHYVPLKGGPEETATQTGKGPGISVNGKQKRALGHTLRDENIIENIWRDHERVLYLAEKQRVAGALKEMLLQAQNPLIGTVGQPEKRAVLQQGWYHQVWVGGRALGAYGSYTDAKAAIASDSQITRRAVSQYSIRHQHADPSVIYSTSPLLADNEVAYYEKGQLVRLQINDELMARAARNLGVDAANGLLKAGQSFNRWLSHAYTGYNPEFLLTNMVRDMTTGMINLTGQYGAKTALTALKFYPKAIVAMRRFIKTGADPLIEQYRRAGGSTGAAYLSDLERIGTDIKGVFQDMQGAKATWASGDKLGAARVASLDKVRLMAGVIERLNQVGENALRVATFKTLLEAGASEADAARAAGDVTVNFNRKGELTSQLGGLYLFFNPSVQGAKTMWDALAKGPHKFQAQALAGALTGLALLLASIGRGQDEKRWRELSGYTKDRNMLIPLGDGDFIKIPVPYGYGAFWSLGNALSDLSHDVDKTKIGIRLASSMFEQFSPIGNPLAGDEVDAQNIVALTPTALKLPVAVALNRTELGRPVMPEQVPWNPNKPDSQRMWRDTHGSLWEQMSSGLNAWTGGDKYRSGAVDVSPETWKLIWRTLTGGVGQFATDSANLFATALQVEPGQLMAREIPIARRFIQASSVRDARRLFFEQAAQVQQAASLFNAAKRDQDKNAMRSIASENRELLALGKVLEKTRAAIKARRQVHDVIQRSELPLTEKRRQLEAIEQREEAIYDAFYRWMLTSSPP